MHALKWSCLSLGAWLCAVVASAQVLEPVSDTRAIYYSAALSCLPPEEVRHTPSAPFAYYSDGANAALDGCAPPSYVTGGAAQTSTILSDSIYIHEAVVRDLDGVNAVTMVVRSEASIVFRIDADPGYGVRYYFEVEAFVFKDGTPAPALARASLSGPGPGGAVRDTLRLLAAPGPPVDTGDALQRRGILRPGEYTLQAVCTAGDGWGRASSELYIRFMLYGMVPVTPSSWSTVKALYRGE